MAKLEKYNPFKERYCPKCGKLFIPTYNYVFTEKHRGKSWCSWTCWNHRKDKDEGTRD